MKYLLISTLSAEDCIKSIKETSRRNTPINWIKSYLVSADAAGDMFFYKINDHKFQIQKYRNYRNSFAPIFYGRIIEEQNGSSIEGRFGIWWFSKMFMIIWLGFAIPVCVFLFYTSLKHPLNPGSFPSVNFEYPIIGLIFPFFFIGLGISILIWGKKIGKRKKQLF